MRVCASLAALLLLASCSKQPDAEKQLRTARSWHSTIDLVSDALHRGKVTAKYANQVAEVAEEELAKDGGDDHESQAALIAARQLREESEKQR